MGEKGIDPVADSKFTYQCVFYERDWTDGALYKCVSIVTGALGVCDLPMSSSTYRTPSILMYLGGDLIQVRTVKERRLSPQASGLVYDYSAADKFLVMPMNIIIERIRTRLLR